MSDPSVMPGPSRRGTAEGYSTHDITMSVLSKAAQFARQRRQCQQTCRAPDPVLNNHASSLPSRSSSQPPSSNTSWQLADNSSADKEAPDIRCLTEPWEDPLLALGLTTSSLDRDVENFFNTDLFHSPGQPLHPVQSSSDLHPLQLSSDLHPRYAELSSEPVLTPATPILSPLKSDDDRSSRSVGPSPISILDFQQNLGKRKSRSDEPVYSYTHMPMHLSMVNALMNSSMHLRHVQIPKGLFHQSASEHAS